MHTAAQSGGQLGCTPPVGDSFWTRCMCSGALHTPRWYKEGQAAGLLTSHAVLVWNTIRRHGWRKLHTAVHRPCVVDHSSFNGDMKRIQAGVGGGGTPTPGSQTHTCRLLNAGLQLVADQIRNKRIPPQGALPDVPGSNECCSKAGGAGNPSTCSCMWLGWICAGCDRVHLYA